MPSVVENLQTWFDEMSPASQEAVVRFLYGGRGNILLREGMYLGPDPSLIQKGLHCGPQPKLSQRLCPTCGRPWQSTSSADR
jgi:hypothetical protein